MTQPAILTPEQIDEQNARAAALLQSGAPPVAPPVAPVPALAQPATGPGAILPPAALTPGGFPGGAPAAIPGSGAAAMEGHPPPLVGATAAQPGTAAAGAGGGPPLIPYGAGAAAQTRPAGLSGADKWMLGTQGGLTEEQAAHADEAIERERQRQKEAGEQSEALALDTRLAGAQFAQQQKENDEHRARLVADAKETHGRIQNQLAELEAKGIDPNHYWQSQGTGSKILAAIAVGLGAFAAHPLGPHGTASENTALNIINSAIANDIDSQKVNLQHGIEVAKMRGLLNSENFDHQAALLKAEQDSTMTAYQIAMNQVDKQAALFKGNAEVQQKHDAMIAGLQQAVGDHVSKYVEQRYALMKNAERPVAVAGPGGIDWKAIRARMMQIEDEAAKAGKDIAPADAQRRAIIDVTGRDIAPGAPVGSYSMPQRAAAGGKNAASFKEARETILANVRELEQLNRDAGVTGLWSPEKKARAVQLQTEIALDWNRANDIGRVGAEAEQHRLEHKVVPDLTSAGLPGAREAVLEGIKKKVERASKARGEETDTEDDEPEKD